MRWVICMTVAMVGCVASLPPGDTSVTADLAAETARMVILSRREIHPSPVSDQCDNCNGTGKIGDGRIVMTCPACGGTGKKPKSVLVRPATCTTGSCRP